MTDEPNTESQPVLDEAVARFEVRRTIWIILVGLMLIALIAAPIRIQFWVIRELRTDQFFWVEERRWERISHIWTHPFETVPDFGSRTLVEVLFTLSAILVIAGVFYGLWLILVEAPEEDA